MKTKKKTPEIKIMYEESKDIHTEESKRKLNAVYDWIFDQVAKENKWRNGG